MFFFLKILNECRGRSLLKADGNSGKRYIFNWDGKLRAYTYHPKNQDEVDDLFRTMGRTTAYIFAPVSIQPPAPAPASDEDDKEQKLDPEGDRTAPVLDDKLVEQCLHRGIVVTEDDSDETAQRLIKAYDKGGVDTLNTLPRKGGNRPQKPEPEKAKSSSMQPQP